MKNNKILIAEHATEAQEFITKLETRLVPAVRFILDSCKTKLGIELPKQKEALFEIAQGHFEDLKAKYWSQNFSDVNHFKSQAARQEINGVIQEKFEDFCRTVSMHFSETIEGRALNNPSLLHFVDLDENGLPYLPEGSRAEIFDSFKEFLTDPKLLKVYDAQQNALKALQTLADSLTNINFPNYQLPQAIVGLFTFTENEDGRGITYIPKQVDYNYLAELQRSHVEV